MTSSPTGSGTSTWSDETTLTSLVHPPSTHHSPDFDDFSSTISVEHLLSPLLSSSTFSSSSSFSSDCVNAVEEGSRFGHWRIFWDDHRALFTSRAFLLRLGVVVASFVVVTLFLTVSTQQGWTGDVLEWIRDVEWWKGGLVLAAIVFVSAAPLPTVFVYFMAVMAASFIYGFLMGLALIVAVATCSTAFFIATTRLLARRRVYASLVKTPMLATIVDALSARGFSLAVIFRLAPVPFGVSNGILAVSSLPFGTVFAAALVGALPKQIAYAVIGARLSDLHDIVSSSRRDPVDIVVLVVQITAACATMVVVAVLANKAISRAIRHVQVDDTTPTTRRG